MKGRSSALWLIGIVLTIAGFIWSLYLIFIRTGLDIVLGFTQKIFYFHVPCAWVTFLAFIVTGVTSVVFLITRKHKWDAIAYSSLEVGTLFTTLVLITGPLWARPTWGAYWVWDARLTTTLVLWLIEIAYLLMRAFIDEPGRAARYSAVLALLGVVDLPIIHYSVVLWGGMHPAVIERDTGGGGMPREFYVALIVSGLTFILLYVLLTAARYRLEVMGERVNVLRQRMLDR